MSRGHIPLTCSIVLLSAIGCGGSPSAAEPSPAKPASVEPAPAENRGRPVKSIFGELTALAFDRDGVLWIGSKYAGVFAFREGKFTLFDVYNTPMPDHGITAVYVDANNTKWFGSARGYLYSFDNTSWKVFHTPTDPGNTGSIVAVRGDPKGRIWFGSGYGRLFRLENDKIELIDPSPKSEDVNDNRRDGFGASERIRLREISCMDLDHHGNLWVGCPEAILRFDGTAWTWFCDDQTRGLVIFGLWCNPKTDEVYVAASNGLYAFKDGHHRTLIDDASKSRMTTVRGTSEGRFAAGFLDGGAVVGVGLKLRNIDAHTPLEHDSVQDIAFDKQGRIWFAGRSRGLYRLDGDKWTTYPSGRPEEIRRASPAQALFAQHYLQDLVREEPVDDDIHEVLKDPRKYLGKKIRIVGRIESSFEWAEMIDSDGKRLGIWPEGGSNMGAIDRTPEDRAKEKSGKNQQKEFVGYLDWGGYFGHMGGANKQFSIIEIYPAAADKTQKAEIKQRYLKYLEKISADMPVPDLIDTPEIDRAREALQGSWTVTEIKNYRWRLRGEVGTHWEISGDRVKTGSPGEWSRAKFRIDPRRSPAAIDFYMTDSPFGGTTLFGIYCLDHDTLKVCWFEGSNVSRPREFEAVRNSRTELFALKRNSAGAATPKTADKEPVAPDDPEAIGALTKSYTRLESDDQGNIVAADFGYIQNSESHGVTDADLAPLKKLRHLERVDVSVYKGLVTDAGLECLANCDHLVRLSLYAVKITDSGLETFSGLRALKMLDIGKSDIKGPGLTSLSRLTGLEELTLRDSPISDDVFKYAARFPSLKILRLDYSKIGDSQAAYLGSCTNLEQLYLSGTKFGDAGMVHLKPLRQLKYLGLLNTKVTDAGISNLKDLATLEELDLGENRIGDAGVSHLKGLTKLKTLNLGKTELTDAGLAHISELPNLEYLKLYGSPVTNAGLEHLQRLPNLDELMLQGTRIDDDGLECLKRFPKLRAVGLSSPRVTRDAAEALAEALPLVHVSYDYKDIGMRIR